MNYRYNNRRAPKRKITGRFYAFLTILLVLVVMLCVFISMRNRAPQQQAYTPAVFDPSATVQALPATDEPAIQADPNQGQTAQAETPTEPPVEQQPTEPDTTATDPATNTGTEAGAEAEAKTVNVGDGIEPETLPSADFAVIEDLKARTDLPAEWTNILLLGSDSRDMKQIEKTRCDTIMIVSLNTTTGQLKMTSVMRDMVIEIPGHGMQKINAATYYGGPRLMIQLLNTNLGLNITQYAIVNFAGMSNIIDILGGVVIDITKDEARTINKHMGEIAAFTMKQADYLAQREEIKLKNWGAGTRLIGIQAVTYARIRELDSDYQRTKRQRKVIEAMLTSIKDANVVQLMQIGNQALSNLKTNVSIPTAAGYAMTVLNCSLESGKRIMEWRIPGDETSTTKNGAQGQGFYDVNYPELATRVYKFIYQS